MEVHAWRLMARRHTPPASVLLGFLETTVRSTLTGANPTRASTAAAAQTTAWFSLVCAHIISLDSHVMTLQIFLLVLAGPVPTGARALVKTMEPSSACARNGSQGPPVPCSTEQVLEPSQSEPNQWNRECLH